MSLSFVNRYVGPPPPLPLRIQHDAGVHELADLLVRLEHHVRVVRTDHDRLLNDEPDGGVTRPVLIRLRVDDVVLLDLDASGVDPVLREERADFVGALRDADLRARQIVVGRDEPDRPERQIGLGLALRHAPHGHEPVGRPPLGDSAADEHATHGESQRDDDCLDPAPLHSTSSLFCRQPVIITADVFESSPSHRHGRHPGLASDDLRACAACFALWRASPLTRFAPWRASRRPSTTS